MNTADSTLALVAADQEGHFTRRQAIGCGFTDKMIRARLRAGHWFQVQRGVYRYAGVPARRTGEAAVASLCLPGGVVSHHSAGRHHGSSLLGTRPVTVTVPAGTTHCMPGIVVHESSDLAPQDCEGHEGVLYTTPVRTVIDLAAVIHAKHLALVVDEFLAAGLVAVPTLQARFDELARRGKPGVRSLRSLLEDRGEGYVPPESVLEAAVLELLDRAGFPAPVRQASLPWRPGSRGRVDLVYPDARLVIECDGRRWHTRERDFERDRRRDNEALLAGWRVFRITWDELRNHPQRILRDLERLLSAHALASR